MLNLGSVGTQGYCFLKFLSKLHKNQRAKKKSTYHWIYEKKKTHYVSISQAYTSEEGHLKMP